MFYSSNNDFYFITFIERIASNEIVVRPVSKLCQGVDVLKRVMEKQCCKLYRGCVYKLIPESTKTYTFFKSVSDYVMGILNQTEVNSIWNLWPFTTSVSGTRQKKNWIFFFFGYLIAMLFFSWYFLLGSRRHCKSSYANHNVITTSSLQYHHANDHQFRFYWG